MLPRFASLICLLPSLGAAGTFYVSTMGTDDPAQGDRAKPWATFAFAVPRLQPGDVLVLLDGTYGSLWVDCTATAAQGTAAAAITVRAENERKATLAGDGITTALRVIGCSYWTFEGLYVHSQDAVNSAGGQTVGWLSDGDHLVLRRMLFSHPNRRVSYDSLIEIGRTTNVLIEESEFYNFSGNGITVFFANGVFRRNYFNSRLWADLPGEPATYVTDRGETAISLGPCDGCIIENCISEQSGALVSVSGYNGPPLHNRVLGSVSLDEIWGIILSGTPAGSPDDNTFENYASVTQSGMGVVARSSNRTRCTSCTAITRASGFGADVEYFPDGGSYGNGNESFFAINSLAVGIDYGFRCTNLKEASLASVNAFGFSIPYEMPSGSDAGEWLNEDPQLGPCRVYLPPTSPMKRRGIGGADIGANVLYRYVDGGLTHEPLWDARTGAFPCGARIAGINDSFGNSCVGVHQRLEVGTLSCPFPPGYGEVDAGPGGGAGGGGAAGGAGGGAAGGAPGGGAVAAGGGAPAGSLSGYAIRCNGCASGGAELLWLLAVLLLVSRRPRAPVARADGDAVARASRVASPEGCCPASPR